MMDWRGTDAEDLVKEAPEELQGIYQGYFLFGVARASEHERVDTMEYLREVHQIIYEHYVFGGASMDDSHMDRILSLHRTIVEDGEVGLPLLLSYLMYMITSMRADARAHADRFLQLQKEDVDRILDSKTWNKDPWIKDVLDALGVRPRTLHLARRVSRILELVRGNEDQEVKESDRSSEGGDAEALRPSIAEYRKVLKDQRIAFLRSILDSFYFARSLDAAGSVANLQCPLDLETIVLSYRESPFIPLSLDPNTFGGETITLLFSARPDRLFKAWIYGRDPDDFRLRAFYDAEAGEDVISNVCQDEVIQRLLADEALSV